MTDSNNSLRSNLKRITPPPLWGAMSDTLYAFKRLSLWPGATFHPVRRASVQKLAQYKDIHLGERCIIIGNGPSLKQTDLSLLRNEYTFGLNRIYLKFPELGFNTSYYLSVNSLVVEQCADDIRALPMPKFISWRSRNLIQPTKDMIFLHTTYSGPKFAHDARGLRILPLR